MEGQLCLRTKPKSGGGKFKENKKREGKRRKERKKEKINKKSHELGLPIPCGCVHKCSRTLHFYPKNNKLPINREVRAF